MRIFNLKVSSVFAASFVAALSLSSQANAGEVVHTQIGVLHCTVDGGVGFIFGSSKKMSCTFKNKQGEVEHYSGKIGKIGIDIGYTKKTKIAWAVLAPSGKYPKKALAGKYGGLSAEITIAGGVGANLLLGGSKKSMALQPLSVQAQTGLNIAGGIGTMSLSYVGK